MDAKELSKYFAKMGRKGSKKRMKTVSAARRKEIGRAAIAARWAKAKKEKR
ncbi:MAG TPA: hypothetical protein VGF61_10415 [Candidatus Acidoferrum sp.]|jgi:hypothetical protein